MADALHLFQAGGWMMYPLVLCSIIVVAIAVERFRFYGAHASDYKKLDAEIPAYLQRGDMEGLKAALRQDGGIPAMVILHAAEQYGTRASQTALIESAAADYMNYLSVIVTLSPLMGLLGTVIGMIGSFNVLSVSSGQPFAVTGGVAEALVCTATGLFVAILALIIHTYFSQRLDHVVSQMEQLSGTYLAIRREVTGGGCCETAFSERR